MMCSVFNNWRLYSCSRFTRTSNTDAVSSSIPVCFSMRSARSFLFACLISRHFFRNSHIIRVRYQLLQLVQIPQPFASDCVRNQLREPRVRHPHEPPRSDTVRLVLEPLRPHHRKIGQRTLLEQPRLQLGHAVRRETPDAGQVGHSYLPLVPLLDDRHPRDPPFIVREPLAHLFQKPPIDLVDDLQMAWQQTLEQIDPPFLQRFR